MDLSALPYLVSFAIVSSITPGPNNLMVMASGANFGLRRTLPHMLGISGGFAIMAFLAGLGLARLFDALPWAEIAMKGLAAAFLLYLAWKIANAAAPKGANSNARPMTFLQAAAFQWVNPKAVYMAITAITAYMPDGTGAFGATYVAVTFAVLNLPCISVWAVAGMRMRQLLTRPRYLRAFNWTMAGLLVLTLIPILRAEI